MQDSSNVDGPGATTCAEQQSRRPRREKPHNSQAWPGRRPHPARAVNGSHLKRSGSAGAGREAGAQARERGLAPADVADRSSPGRLQEEAEPRFCLSRQRGRPSGKAGGGGGGGALLSRNCSDSNRSRSGSHLHLEPSPRPAPARPPLPAALPCPAQPTRQVSRRQADGDAVPLGCVRAGGRTAAGVHMLGTGLRSRWPVGVGLESSVSVAPGETPKGAPRAKGQVAPRGEPSHTLSPTVPRQSLWGGPRGAGPRSKTWWPRTCPWEGRSVGTLRGRARREAGALPLRLTGCLSPPASLPERASRDGEGHGFARQLSQPGTPNVLGSKPWPPSHLNGFRVVWKGLCGRDADTPLSLFRLCTFPGALSKPELGPLSCPMEKSSFLPWREEIQLPRTNHTPSL